MAQLLLKLPISVLLFLSLSTSSLAITLTKEGCVDPTGFATCKSAATSVAATCLAKNCAGEGQCTDENNCDSTDANCVTSCVCAAYEAWINCALESCWNKVWFSS